MVELTLVNFFALVLLITDISMANHHQVAAFYFCLDDYWADENCEKGVSINCMTDCINKYGDTSNGFCEFDNCYCQYKCPESPNSPNSKDSPIEPHN